MAICVNALVSVPVRLLNDRSKLLKAIPLASVMLVELRKVPIWELRKSPPVTAQLTVALGMGAPLASVTFTTMVSKLNAPVDPRQSAVAVQTNCPFPLMILRVAGVWADVTPATSRTNSGSMNLDLFKKTSLVQ